jgi:hypothetical protein
VPGTTSEAVAAETIERSPLLRECQLHERLNVGRWFQCQGAILYIDVSTGLVDSVGFIPAQVFTLQGTIASHGEPDYLYFVPDGVPEDQYIMAFACFPRINARVDLPRQKWPTYQVTPDLEVENVVYGYGRSGGPCFDGVDNWKKEWRGYGDY